MSVGSFFAALGYKLYVKLGTTASNIPTTSAGMTRILSLDNTGIQGTSESTSVVDYDSEQGFQSNLITSQSYSIPCSMNLDVTDAGYEILKKAAINAASGSLLEWYRETPVTDASGDDPEVHAGLAQIGDFSEDIVAGNVAKVSFTLTGYGAYKFYPQGNPAATLTITTAGSGLTPATYTAVALISSSPAAGIGSGKGATADIVVAAGGTVTATPTIVAGGTNYRVGDILTVALGDVGGSGTDVVPTFTVATVS
ncbi:MAG: phage tail tube protein [Candidatus Limnocylindrus sp.]